MMLERLDRWTRGYSVMAFGIAVVCLMLAVLAWLMDGLALASPFLNAMFYFAASWWALVHWPAIVTRFVNQYHSRRDQRDEP